MPIYRLLLLMVMVEGYDNLSAAYFWNTTVVDVRSMSPPRSRISGILHVHIPKTGGSSLVNELWTPMMENSVDLCMLKSHKACENQVFWANGEACNWTAPAVITGHVSFDIVRASAIMEAKRVFSLTLLREPLSRVVSYTNFLNVPFKEFIEGKWSNYTTNLATMMLNGVRGTRRSPVKGMCEYDSEEASSSATRQVVEVITVFGITEHYVETMWLFKETFGWDFETVKGPLLNAKQAFCSVSVSRKKCGKNRYTVEDIDPDIQTAIREAEICDGAVYQTALHVFKARIEAGDQRDLADFRSAISTATSALSANASVSNELT